METPRLLLERMQRRAKKEWLLVSYSWIWMLSLPSKLIGNAECTKQWQFYTCTLSIIREYFLLLFGAKNNFIWLVLVLLKMNKIVYFAFSLHYHLRIDKELVISIFVILIYFVIFGNHYKCLFRTTFSKIVRCYV